MTEAAALSAVVALGVSLFFYRGFHWRQTLSVVAIGLRSAASIMLIIATALAVGHGLTQSGAPARFVELLLTLRFTTWQFLLAINGLLLVLGCFLEVTATLLLVLPILAPALSTMGIDPIHFSIIFTHNMEIGLVHPPVGLNPLRSFRGRRRPYGCGYPGHPAVSRNPADCACRHHLRANVYVVAAGCRLRIMNAPPPGRGLLRLGSGSQSFAPSPNSPFHEVCRA